MSPFCFGAFSMLLTDRSMHSNSSYKWLRKCFSSSKFSPSYVLILLSKEKQSWRKHTAKCESSCVKLCFHCVCLNGLYLIDESQCLCLNDFQFPSVSISAVQTHKPQVGFLTLLCWCSFPLHLKWPPELNVIGFFIWEFMQSLAFSEADCQFPPCAPHTIHKEQEFEV